MGKEGGADDGWGFWSKQISSKGLAEAAQRVTTVREGGGKGGRMERGKTQGSWQLIIVDEGGKEIAITAS